MTRVWGVSKAGIFLPSLVLIVGLACQTTRGASQGTVTPPSLKMAHRGKQVDPAGQLYFDAEQCAAIGPLCLPARLRNIPFRYAYIDFLLGELGEPSLRPEVRATEETYRIIVATSFDGTAVFRLDVLTDDSGSLTLWNLYDYCGNLPSGSDTPTVVTLDGDETRGLLEVLEAIEFRALPAIDGGRGLDGASYFVEGGRADEHHLVERWSRYAGALLPVVDEFSRLVGCRAPP